MKSDNKINLKYILVAALACIFSWLIHEFAHWLTGELLGYEMRMRLNSSYPVTGEMRFNWQTQLVSAAGPIVTLIEAIIVYQLMKRKDLKLAYPFLFTCFSMRLLAALLSFKMPNDEARISASLHIGMFTLPLLMCAVLFFMLYKIAVRYQFHTKFNLLNALMFIAYCTIIITVDQVFKFKIL